MAVQKIDIETFIPLRTKYPVLDVRSPTEYEYANIPGAYSFPLFTNEERHQIGTLYKVEGRKKAVLKGLEYFGPKMQQYIEAAESIIKQSKIGGKSSTEDTFVIHCWRGGMRSAGIAWLLDLYGFNVFTLVGGYKSFRHWAIEMFVKSWSFNCLGGYTGSAKTKLLGKISDLGGAVIDLEKIANHKGSAFGGIGNNTKQPSQEMFENLLAIELFEKSKSASKNNKNIWIEDESQRIGTVNIPQNLWNTLRKSKLLFLNIPFEKRLDNIVLEYGKLDRNALISAISRIQKRLGGLETANAIKYMEDGDIYSSFSILLKYYDKLYKKALNNKIDIIDEYKEIEWESVGEGELAEKIISHG